MNHLKSSTLPIDNMLRQQITDCKTPGLYYAFFDAAEIRHEIAIGHADVKNAVPVSAATAFYGYSVTKIFTATAVMQLVEQGKISLDAPVVEYLSDFAFGRDIRVRHLLSHSSGLPNPLPMSWIHRAEDEPGFDEAAFIREVFQKTKGARSKPNENFAYSNLNYLALGELIGKVSGMTFRQYIDRHLLQALSIQEQIDFVRQPQWQVATGYHRTFSFGNLLLGFLLDKKRYMGESFDGWTNFLPMYVNGSAYGGLVGTPGGFITFAQDLLQRDSQLLTMESRREMWEDNRLHNGRLSGMSKGWFRGNLSGNPYVCHAGGGGGFYCELRLYPESGLGSAVFMNRSGFSDERFLDRADAGWFAGSKTQK